MTAPGFCTCRRDFPGIERFHPPAGATWHYLCERPTVPPPAHPVMCEACFGIDWTQEHTCSNPGGCFCFCQFNAEPTPVTRPTGTGWPS